jgi:hypothetical protein
MANRRRIKKKIRRAALRYGIDPDVFEAQIGQESGFQQGLTSSAGAKDIAQFIPSTAKQYGVTLGDGKVDDDIDGAARYMRDNLKRTGGNYKQALSIYNSGRPDGYLSIAETKNYVQTILGNSGGAQKTAPRSAPRSAAPSYTTETVPGVDRSADRRALRINYLSERGKPGALLNLGLSLRDAQDTPDSQVQVPTPGQPQPPARNRRQGSGSTNIRDIITLAQSYGLHVGENPLVDKVDPVHAAGSYHYQKAKGAPGAAADVSGDPAQMRKFARVLARRYGKDLEELIWRGPGSRTIKKGKKVPKNFYSAHTDHVHVADTD